MSRQQEFQLGTVSNRALIDVGLHYQNRATQFAVTRRNNLSARKYAQISLSYHNAKEAMNPQKAERMRGRMKPRISQFGMSMN